MIKMVSEEFLMIERVGVAFSAFYLTFRLLTKYAERAYIQSDAILKLANETILENTNAIHRMCEGLEIHIKQKDAFIGQMLECRHQHEQEMKDIRDTQLDLAREKRR